MQCIGVDIIEITRIEEAVSRWGERFLTRIYRETEVAYCQNRAPQLAVRFAAKEATMKALGVGFTDINWIDIEIVTDASGAPSLKLHGRALQRFDELGLSHLKVSLSHSRENAIAMVVGG